MRKINYPKTRKSSTVPILPEGVLRKCSMCGLEARREEDLVLFTKARGYPHGRGNRCKKCTSKERKEYYKIHRFDHPMVKRQLELINNLPKPIMCYFCGKEVTEIFSNDTYGEHLIIHSLDGNHENWNPENKVPAHNKCHIHWHIENKIENAIPSKDNLVLKRKRIYEKPNRVGYGSKYKDEEIYNKINCPFGESWGNVSGWFEFNGKPICIDYNQECILCKTDDFKGFEFSMTEVKEND